MSAIYAINGVIWPKGGQYVHTAVDVTGPAVSFPDSGYGPDDGAGFDTDPHLYWKFTATEIGKVTFDAHLPYVTATGAAASVQVSVASSNVGSSPSSWSDLTFIGTSGSHGRTITTAPGVTYVVILWNFGTLGDTKFILLASDYGVSSDWVQPADQAYVTEAPTMRTDDPWHTPSTIPIGNLAVSSFTYDFHGNYGVAKPFGVPGGDSRNPALVPDPNAIICIWNHSIQNADPGVYWTVDGSVDGATPGACQVVGTPAARQDSSQRVGGHYAGSLASGGIGGGYADAVMDVYNVVQRVSFSEALTFWGPTGGLAAPYPGPGGLVEYEATEGTLLGVDTSPDETVHGEGTDIAVQWYGKVVGFYEGDGEWGPYQDWVDPGGGPYPVGAFMDGPPGAFPAKQDFQLTDFPVAPTSAPAWETLDPDMLAAALANEAVFSSSTSETDTWQGSLRFVSQFPEMLEIDPPGQLRDNPAPASVNDYRNEQFVAIRMHVRPPRYKLHAVPVLPTVEVPELVGAPDAVRVRFWG